MTRPIREVEAALDLRGQGLGARRIAAALGIPVKTVQEWIQDPSHALARSPLAGVAPFTACAGSCKPWLRVDPAVYSYLLGMYLGDGHVVRMPRCYRLSIFCDPKYPAIMEEVGEAIAAVFGAKVGRRVHAGAIAVTGHSQHIPCFFPQHGPGMKHNRKIELAGWQKEVVTAKPRPFIRGLIQSDGWRGKNVAVRQTDLAIERRHYTRYQFTNHSEDIRNLFCWALDLLDVHWTRSNQWTISVSRKKDVFYLDSFVGPKR